MKFLSRFGENDNKFDILLIQLWKLQTVISSYTKIRVEQQWQEHLWGLENSDSRQICFHVICTQVHNHRRACTILQSRSQIVNKEWNLIICKIHLFDIGHYYPWKLNFQLFGPESCILGLESSKETPPNSFRQIFWAFDSYSNINNHKNKHMNCKLHYFAEICTLNRYPTSGNNSGWNDKKTEITSKIYIFHIEYVYFIEFSIKKYVSWIKTRVEK